MPIIILPYYSVIGGWVLKYLAEFVKGNADTMANDSFFGDFISAAGAPTFWLLYSQSFYSVGTGGAVACIAGAILLLIKK